MARDNHRAVLGRAALAAAIFLAILGLATAVFSAFEHESGKEAFFLGLGALTTVDIAARPTNETERVLLAGFRITAGLFYLLLVGSVIQFVLIRQAFSATYNKQRAVRKAGRMKGHVIVCGFGRVGRALTKLLIQNGQRVVVVEGKEQNCAEARALGATAIPGDAQRIEVLKEAGAGTARWLIACVGSDANNVYIALAAREAAHQADGRADGLKVVVRASDELAQVNLEGAHRLGLIDSVISPYESMSESIFKTLGLESA